MKRNFQGLLIILALLVLCALPKTLGDGDGEVKGTGKSPAFGSLKKDSSKEVYTNETNNDAGEGEDGGKPKETIAHFLDEALKEEFSHEEEKKAAVGRNFNETVSANEGTTETVVIISQKKEKEANGQNRTTTAEESSTEDTPSSEFLSKDKATSSHAVTHDSVDDDDEGDSKSGSNSSGSKSSTVEVDVDRIIDSKDNEYVLSKPNEEGSLGLTLDPRLIREFSILIGASAVAALAMEAVRQPTINGYFVAGSLVGPGGLGLVKEIVQVQSVSQLGVQLLLFTLGLEFNFGKLRAVRSVAVLGGALQVGLMAGLGGAAAAFIGASTYQGTFLGALLAMSSTSVVVKCLQEAKASHTLHAQITIGMLVFQDCVVGLLFAFMPVLASEGIEKGLELGQLAIVSVRVLGTLALTAAVAAAAAATFLPFLARAAARYSSETFQLATLGFCLAAGMATTRLGISGELGAFLAGVLLSATEQQDAVLAAAQPATHLFLALFVASTGLTIPPSFLAEHFLVLTAGTVTVVIAKSLLFAGVVAAFRYPLDIALAVGLNMAQVGEFGFVLLSMANRYNLIGSQVYLLLMGTTALSLLLTPILLQLSVRIPRNRDAGALDPEQATHMVSGVGDSDSALSLRKESPVACIIHDDSPRGSMHEFRKESGAFIARRAPSR